ncbi:MAG: pyrimidine 5-nucleotidase [Betaproteobacteria bacterium]|nr:pyrimidine 5-nucleotidase [Betaproteobacteria bacterium]
MTTYMQTHLGLDEAGAGALRQHYWQRYGATLTGLIRNHATDPRHFLKETHDFPALDRMVVREPGLRATLSRLPGRKIVFSNAPVHYATQVLNVLGIADLFDDLFSIEHTGFRPKPDSYGFLKLFRRNRVRARACIMVEDTLANLKTAKKLGMSTVYVTRARGARPSCTPAYVDYSIKNLLQLPRLAWHFN